MNTQSRTEIFEDQLWPKVTVVIVCMVMCTLLLRFSVWVQEGGPSRVFESVKSQLNVVGMDS